MEGNKESEEKQEGRINSGRAREVVTCNSPHNTQVGREKLRSRSDSVKTMSGGWEKR